MLRSLGFSRAAIFSIPDRSIPDRAKCTFSVLSDELRLVSDGGASRVMIRVLPGPKAWVVDHVAAGQIELHPRGLALARDIVDARTLRGWPTKALSEFAERMALSSRVRGR